MIKEYFFDDREALFSALSQSCETLLTTALAARPEASLMVSGGSTPAPLYRRLSAMPLPWQRVQVALVDERWLGVDQTGSNEKFITDCLLQDRAAKAQLTGMKTPDASAAAGLAACEQRYQALPRPFDLTLLGMGPDGHTASLFPGAQGLTTALNREQTSLCSAINAKPTEVTGALTERMSLSLRGLLQSRQLLLLITGEDKLAVLRQAQAQLDPKRLPISALLHQNAVPLNIYWAP